MKLQVDRFEFGSSYTIGRLYIDGVYYCYTLEDKMRETSAPVAEWKVFGETAIPQGHYDVILDYSNHFKDTLPHILNVPGYEGVRIHAGNSPEDTEGCILVGMVWPGNGTIGNSKIALRGLLTKFFEVSSRHEQITIDVVNKL